MSNTQGRSPSAATLVAGLDRGRVMRFSLAGLRLSDHRLLLRAGDLTVAAISVLVALAGWSVTAEETFSLEFVRAQAAWFFAVVPWMLLLLPSYHVSVVFSTKATAQIIGRTAIVGLAVYPLVYFIAPPRCCPGWLPCISW